MIKYPGRKIYSNDNLDNVYETMMNVDILFRNNKMRDLRKPNIQGSLEDNRVNDMIIEYKKNRNIFKSKNKLVVVDLNGTYYLVDGQHRYEMLKMLFEEDNNFKEHVQLVWYPFTKEEEIIVLFKSLNKDSAKNLQYINLDELLIIKINEFLDKLKKYNNKSFAKKKTNKGYLKTLEELKDELININFFKNDKTSNELYDELILKNNEYYDLLNYETNMNNGNDGIYYENEKEVINEKIIFTLKNNNFIKWLSGEEKIYYHNYRKQKKSIAPYLKKQVWRKYYGEELEAECPIFDCNNIMNKTKKNGMQCGHIISEKNGGKVSIDNLRPICATCNCRMGDINWFDYSKINK
jgi:hypothetical protein